MSTDTWLAALFDKPLDDAALKSWGAFRVRVLDPAPVFSKLRAFSDERGRRGYVHVHFERADPDVVHAFTHHAEELARRMRCEVTVNAIYEGEEDDEEFDAFLTPQPDSPWRKIGRDEDDDDDYYADSDGDDGSEHQPVPLMRRFDRALDPRAFAAETAGVMQASYVPMYPPSDLAQRQEWAAATAAALRSASPGLLIVDIGGLRLFRGSDGLLSATVLPLVPLPEDATVLLRGLKGLLKEVSASLPIAPLASAARELLGVEVRVGLPAPARRARPPGKKRGAATPAGGKKRGKRSARR